MEEGRDGLRVRHRVWRGQEISEERKDRYGKEKQNNIEESGKAERRKEILRPGVRLRAGWGNKDQGRLRNGAKSGQSEEIDRRETGADACASVFPFSKAGIPVSLSNAHRLQFAKNVAIDLISFRHGCKLLTECERICMLYFCYYGYC